MQYSETRAREARRTQAAPVDLEHGRFEPGQVVSLFAIALAGLVAGSAGGLLCSWGLAGSTSEWPWLASLSVWVALFGALLLALGLALAGAVTVLAARGWWRHQARVDDWHYAQLDAYAAAGGQESEREYVQRSLTTSEPAHALLVALAVAERAQAGAATPWSGPALTGELWYGDIRIGDLSKPQAEEFSRLLAQVGVVTGRRRGYAGQLVSTEPAELLRLVARNYKKYQPGRVERQADEE